jgi:hypothetical protein
MKNLTLIQLTLICFILNSCQSKTEIKPKPVENYAIQHYKLDDDEMEKRKIADSLAKETNLKERKIDSLINKK